VLWSIFTHTVKLPYRVIKLSYQSQEESSVNRKLTKKLLQLQQLTSAGPSKLLGLTRKGLLKAGCHADMVVFDPFKFVEFNLKELEQATEGLNIDFSTNMHIFSNRTLLGSVEYVFIRGCYLTHYNLGKAVLEQIDPVGSQR
jgi:dihydroorotase-like cyclic amidohydrolase